jgi:uncharacterized protein
MTTGQLILNPSGQVLSGNRPRPGRAGSIKSHLWTVIPSLLGSVRPVTGPPSQSFHATVEDSIMGKVRLTGLSSYPAHSDTLVLIVHGLAGNALSPYCAVAAQAAHDAGYACLRLSMRGADLSGEDIFHGGLTDDLRAALASPELARFRRVLLFGYSVGGHIALRAGIEQIDPRIRAIAAICPPLDLDAATVAFDAPRRRFYRRQIFNGLDKAYAMVAARRPMPYALAVVKRARSCRHRDALTVVPRFGFASEEDYYRRASVSTEIHRLAIPSLLVASLRDPIIPAETLHRTVSRAPASLNVRWVDSGGHIYFPPTLDLGERARHGLESQAISWLGRQ